MQRVPGAHEGRLEEVRAKRFAKEVVHASAKRVQAVLVEGAGCEGDDPRAILVGGKGADAAGGLVSVHAGHLDIHEDDVELAALKRADGLGSVGDDVGLVAEAAEGELGDALVHGVVLGEQDGQRHGVAGAGVARLGGGRGGSGGRNQRGHELMETWRGEVGQRADAAQRKEGDGRESAGVELAGEVDALHAL